MPKSSNAFWNFFTKETPADSPPLACCKKCGQKIKMYQSSTSTARYHLKTKHPLEFAKLTNMQADAEDARAEEMSEIRKATQKLDEAQDKVALYTLSQHDKQKAQGTQKSIAQYVGTKYPSQHKRQLEADMEIMKFIARTGTIKLNIFRLKN